MEPTLKAVLCPCCRNLLYALEMSTANNRQGWTFAQGTPPVESDPQGSYLKCPRCTRRIALEKSNAPGGPEWQLSKTQACT